jgi:hypothetical protein
MTEWDDGKPCFADVDGVLSTLGVTLEMGLSPDQANTNWKPHFPKPRVGFFGRIMGMFGCGARTGMEDLEMESGPVASVLRNGEWSLLGIIHFQTTA